MGYWTYVVERLVVLSFSISFIRGKRSTSASSKLWAANHGLSVSPISLRCSITMSRSLVGMTRSRVILIVKRLLGRKEVARVELVDTEGVRTPTIIAYAASLEVVWAGSGQYSATICESLIDVELPKRSLFGDTSEFCGFLYGRWGFGAPFAEASRS